MSNKSNVAKLGNPAAVGLAGFALTTWLSSMINAGWFPGDATALVVVSALAYGGGAQVIAGVLEFIGGNTFGGTASLSYGCFWLSYSIFVQFLRGNVSHAFIGWYFFLWGMFTLYMWVATLRSPRALQIVFLLLWMALFLLSGSEWTASTGLRVASGYIGLLTAVSAFYLSAAIVINDAHGKSLLPIGEAGR
ncbi:acetate uptake transporter [Paraburkholderia sp. FT54]|uniref:acetate uptake transporter n=1 Tax=Paraburkholderia sp. FT54 TaxID=3074437 RepID=UPI002877BD07|nr:acetate uptake transporter [Paraburkholderia sp. FT54]WNC93195.1 acetate uptake transporter [Paraburkholderia sp. FT54]